MIYPRRIKEEDKPEAERFVELVKQFENARRAYGRWKFKPRTTHERADQMEMCP